MFEFAIRDRHQPGVLDKHHFGYHVIYDPVCRYHTWQSDAGKPCQILTRFYANRHRIYDKGGDVIRALWNELKIAEGALYNFATYQNEQIIGIFRFFDVSNAVELEEQIYQAFLELIPYWHPKYAAVVDSYGQSLTPEEVAAVIAGRQKFQPSGPRSPVANSAYSRYIPPRLRTQVLVRDGSSCLRCGAANDLHVDHIIPVAKGGLTMLSNLQTLCAPHNLMKGGRDSTDYRITV